jgi:hypothetical protein
MAVSQDKQSSAAMQTLLYEQAANAEIRQLAILSTRLICTIIVLSN